jgi:hypothetical protein
MGEENTQDQTQTQMQTIDGDMLANLIAVATEKNAKREAEEALKKGFVTREQINTALSQLSDNVENTLSEKLGANLSELVEKAVKAAITVDASTGKLRKGTLLGGVSLDEREADPIAYLIKKGKELGPESYDEVDKRILWAVTYKALSSGMILDQDEDDA